MIMELSPLFNDFFVYARTTASLTHKFVQLFVHYSGPCDLRLPIQPAKYGLKLKVVLK